jgi:4-aminobutyrate aminotransferase/(S)-3-amino-2-methylpropionate transaminase
MYTHNRAHEAWGLSDPPDFVTFSKKFLAGGIFHMKEAIPQEVNRIGNTWMGDPVRLVLLAQIVKVIKEQNLLTNVVKTGTVLLNGLEDLQTMYPTLTMDARGVGTFCALNFKDQQTRDKVIAKMKMKGVITGGCGERTVRLRPSLIFQQKHADIYLDVLEHVLKGLN